ncbi:MAG: peptide chain release factor N(5)-glutamine methyltransferase, partial [Gammaproteobacteria bacterium]
GIANVRFLQGDWYDALPPEMHVDVIVSNPPYVATEDPHLQQGDVRFEPQQALVSGKDGLDAIRHLIPTGKDYLFPGGWLMLEHGYDQGEQVRALFVEHGYKEVQQRQDLGGHVRLSMGRV